MAIFGTFQRSKGGRARKESEMGVEIRCLASFGPDGYEVAPVPIDSADGTAGVRTLSEVEAACQTLKFTRWNRLLFAKTNLRTASDFSGNESG